MNNLLDCLVGDSVLRSKRLQRRATLVCRSNLTDIIIGQARLIRTFAARHAFRVNLGNVSIRLGSHSIPISGSESVTVTRILRILLSRSNVQMSGVDTPTVIAGVQCHQAVRDHTLSHFDNEATGPMHLSAGVERGVSILEEPTGPKPAPIGVTGLVNLVHETGKGIRYSGHVNLLEWLAVPSAVSAARGLFVPTSIPKSAPLRSFS
ncbi:MAG: hypothetical protein WKF63_08650 [Thermomicrobiales bacterium]